ncbi:MULTISPECIES: sulfate/molybdate ABC transporter ATP-binding protein [Gammaproteobacteria]|uniref:sulfate/molybdate ABC transporter ATP-binding protein n=1 Tax=Xanthomonas boreopolis TaxID=86183 RepID=UPI00112B848E
MGIRIQNLRKQFDDFTALDAINLDIHPGELLALLGPSGSGKTTLLRIIAGLEYADGGQVLFGNEDATSMSVQSRRVGFVFQHYALFKHMTVYENIAFGLRVRRGEARWAESRIRERVQELLALVQLQGLEKRYPTQLSGGQRQRVALARALAIEPRVLLLDEPFGALDAQVRRDLRRWLRELHERTGLTTVFVTHDQEEALELADRVAILNGGRIEQLASPAAVYDEPASPFVYSFVGAVNRIAGTVQRGHLDVAGLSLPLEADVAPGQVELYVRPEDLVPASEGWRATVLSTQRSGARLRVRARLERAGEVELELPAAVGHYAAGQSVTLAARRYGIFPATEAG